MAFINGKEVLFSPVVNISEYEKGKKAAYDEFWDTYQRNGDRRAYTYAFCGEGWTDESFDPKYPIIVEGSLTFFMRGAKVKDKRLYIDTSAATSLYNAFYQTSLKWWTQKTWIT